MGAHVKLSSEIHDHLSNPHHAYLFMADLKHAYLTIPLHPLKINVGHFDFFKSGLLLCDIVRRLFQDSHA